MEDTVLNNIMSEFRLYGIKPEIRHTPGGHLELAWQASPDKEIRKTFIPKTGSDWRGWLNQRSNIRRLFRQDGLSLKQPDKPIPAIKKALSAPAPVEPHQDQLRAVRAELADLTDMVLELGTIVSGLSDTVKQSMRAFEPAPRTAPVALAIEELMPPAPPPPRPVKPNFRSIKAIDHVSENWNTLDALAASMGVEAKFAYRKLYYLMRKEEVERSSDGCWRRRPMKKTNGNGRHHVMPPPKRRGRPPLNGRHR